MYAFGVLMLRLATNLPALLDAGTPHSNFLSVYVRRELLGGTWDDFGSPVNGGGVRRPEDVTPAAWLALDVAAVEPRCDWDADALARFGALALRCTEAAREARPPMADVAAELQAMLAALGGGSSDLIPEPPVIAPSADREGLSLGRGAVARGPPEISAPLPPPPDLTEAIAAWWTSQQSTASASSPDWVVTPGAFDVEVAPGGDVQLAVDNCRAGGSVLLLPGTHEGPLVLAPRQDVRVFGRGRAALRSATTKAVLTFFNNASTVDGLILRREADGSGECGAPIEGCGVLIEGGQARLQACDITSVSIACIALTDGAKPVLALCRRVRPPALACSPFFCGFIGVDMRGPPGFLFEFFPSALARWHCCRHKSSPLCRCAESRTFCVVFRSVSASPPPSKRPASPPLSCTTLLGCLCSCVYFTSMIPLRPLRTAETDSC